MTNQNIILGTAQFMDGYGLTKSYLDNKEIENILNLAEVNKIEYIDTAYEYINVQQKLGCHNLKNFKIISKLPNIKALDKETISIEINEVLEKSLKQLKINKIDTILIHNLENMMNFNRCSKIINVLKEFKKKNIINKLGLSIYSPYILSNFDSLSDLDTIQSPLNLIDQNLISSGFLNKLKIAEVEINVRSIFLQGLLLKTDKEYLKSKFKNSTKIWDTWFNFLENQKLGISAVKVCLDFARLNKDIDNIVIGFNNYKQMKQILNYMKIEPIKNFPNIRSSDTDLIYPYNWSLND